MMVYCFLLFRKVVTVCIKECRLETFLPSSNAARVISNDASQSTTRASATHKSVTASWLSVFRVRCAAV